MRRVLAILFTTFSHLHLKDSDILFPICASSHLFSHLEVPACRLLLLDKLSHQVLDWLTARLCWPNAAALSPLSPFPPVPSCGRCCLVCVAMVPCGQFKASHAASCVVFTEGSWQDWGLVTQNRLYMTVGAWAGARDSAALCDTPQVTVTQSTHSEERHSPSWLHWIFIGLCSCFLTYFFLITFSFLIALYFNVQPFFPERGLGFPSYYALQWIPVAQCLARDLRSSPFMCATGRSHPIELWLYSRAWLYCISLIDIAMKAACWSDDQLVAL